MRQCVKKGSMCETCGERGRTLVETGRDRERRDLMCSLTIQLSLLFGAKPNRYVCMYECVYLPLSNPILLFTTGVCVYVRVCVCMRVCVCVFL